MLEITSTGCGKYHHAEFRLRFDGPAAVERDARELVACLERHISRGHTLRPGDHFSYGWVHLRFEQIEENLITVKEPDFIHVPAEDIDSVTNTLRHLRWQKTCASAVGIDQALTIPAMDQTAAICPGVRNATHFVMERHSACLPSSGWTIGCAEPIHDHAHGSDMMRASLYEIVARFHAAIAAFVALPPGTKVLNGPQGLWISCDGRSHHVRNGSFLDQLTKSADSADTASILLDDSHNLLKSPAGKQVSPYVVPVSRHLVVRCESGSSIFAPPEIRALGIQEPNTALLLSKGTQWRKVWNGACSVEFDLTQTESSSEQGRGPLVLEGTAEHSLPPGSGSTTAKLRPGDELILIVGYSDPAPDSITKGGIAAMWSGRVKIA